MRNTTLKRPKDLQALGEGEREKGERERGREGESKLLTCTVP